MLVLGALSDSTRRFALGVVLFIAGCGGGATSSTPASGAGAGGNPAAGATIESGGHANASTSGQGGAPNAGSSPAERGGSAGIPIPSGGGAPSGKAGTANGDAGTPSAAHGGAPATGGGSGTAGARTGGAGGVATAGAAGQAGAPARCTTTQAGYFVDATLGDDANDGRAPDRAWKSIAKVNATTFVPGDALCFKSGTSYAGELHPLGSGSSGAPITVARYGDGARPKVAAGAADANAFSLYNQQYWDVTGLELTNQRSSVADVRGISIRASNAGTLTHVHVSDCFVHDVTGEVKWIGGSTDDNAPGIEFQTGWDASKRTGGIVLEVDASAGTDQKTRFDDVLFENNVISDTSFGGIVVKQLDGNVHWGARSSAADSKFSPHTNVVIRGNFISQANTSFGCNAVYLTGVRTGLVEGNVVAQAGTSGIELYNTDAVTVQNNEIFGTVRKASGADFNGIDTDKATTGSVIQYNYVHDNGDGILLCQLSFGDSIVRYNLIVNSSRYGLNLHSDASATNATYNNLFFAEGLSGASLVNTSGDGSALAAIYAIENDILHTTRTSDAVRTGSGVTYRNNLYSGLPAATSDPAPQTGSPRFVDPSSRMNGGMAGPAFASLSGFKLESGSPALHAGTSIAENGGRDFWGTPLPSGAPDIGPYQAP